MKTYEERNRIGELKSFEVGNLYLSRRAVVRILSTVPEVVIVREPKRVLSGLREDVFCEFEIGSQLYFVEESFGGSSRFCVSGPRYTSEFEKIAEVFRAAIWPYKYL